MNKKTYEPPVVTKVRLEIKNSVLALCHSSTVGDSMDVPPGCRVNNTCFVGAPGGPPVRP
jgi:hypothetical protein